MNSFCNALASTECSPAVVKACLLDNSASDTAACVAARSPTSICNPANLPYHPQTAEVCIAAYAAVYANSSWTREALDTVDKACIAVFSNSGPIGATCTGDTDCDTTQGLSCVVKGTAGTCQRPVAAMPGDPCTAVAAQCDDKHFCDTMANGCLTKKAAGVACTDPGQCADGADCTGNVCVAKLMKNTDICAEDSDCVSCATGTTGCTPSFCLKGEGMAKGNCSATLLLDHFSADCDPYK